MKPTNLQPLSEVEKNIIINKGTEPPFVGEYCSTKTKGIYYCKQCNNPLYVSTAKFESSCGWPAFEEEIKGSVKRSIDKDGVRTEITCSFCGGHLGHVFVGEHLTKANVRHCVNSISLKFIEENKQQIIYVAGGCFWGVEHYLKQFGDVTVGYMGGDKPFPTYKEICRGNSGYYETVKIQFNPQENQLVDILKYFFEIHDFTDTNGQGPDRGEQYSSVVFYLNDEQKTIINSIIESLKQKRYKVATHIQPAKMFWPAEEYHQHYYEKSNKTPYCHKHKKVF